MKALLFSAMILSNLFLVSESVLSQDYGNPYQVPQYEPPPAEPAPIPMEQIDSNGDSHFMECQMIAGIMECE